MLFCRAKSRVDFACAVQDLTWTDGKDVRKFFCLFWIESVEWYVNDRNAVRKVVKLCSNDCLLYFRS